MGAENENTLRPYVPTGFQISVTIPEAPPVPPHNLSADPLHPQRKARYACLRGIYGTFKNDVDGSDKRYSFSLPSADKDSPYVAVTESPVDALSVASLLKMQGEDWTKNHYLSLGGTAPRALLRFLHDHPAVNCISLCLDNDRAGLSGMEKIREALKEDAELSRCVRVVVDNPPPDFGGKDYNELLQKAAARYAAAKREKTKPDCGMEK